MTSLRQRLRRVVIVLVVGLLSQWFIADWMIVHVDESEMATRLQHDADSLVSAIAVSAEGGVAVDFSRVGQIYTRQGSGHYFVLRSARAVLASPSFGDASPFAVPATASESVTRIDGPFGQPLLVLVRHLWLGDAVVDMAVGEDLSALQAQLLQFRLLFLAASAIILAASAAIQRREIRRALRSVEQARDAILRLPKGVEPVAAADAPEEIRPLLEEIDRLMGFVERRLHESRTAIGNLSHAVKTPLAGLLRLAEDPLLEAHPELRHALHEQIEAIRLRIERELTRARIAGDRRSGPGFDAHAELPALVQMLTRIHRDKPLDIRWQAPERVLPFDREDLLEVLGNLADNACKWAASQVRIAIEELDGLRIVVADDGPGCAPELLDSLGARGLRADETRPGHGIGLAIVRDIADAAGGSLQFRRSASLGGLEVEVRLPR
ncbi:MAG TPA: ATP-binding protein [Albitalea sp.]|nr:ATP-binding protein [Albitalea sp.]